MGLVERCWSTPPVADSLSNGLTERGIRSVEEMTRVLLFDLSSRVGSPNSVLSPVFPWIVEHSTDILNKCHVASDGKSAYERLKKRPPRRAFAIWCFGDVQSCWEGSRRSHDGEVAHGHVAGKTFPHRRTPEPTTMGDLDAMKGSSWSPSGVLRDVLPDVPRPTLSRDDPSVETEEERPVPRNMKITQDILKKFGYTPGCAKCRKLSRNEYFHPSLAHSQDCSIRIEAASKADPTYRDRVSERWISTRKWEQMDHARRASLEPSIAPRPPAAETEVEDRSSVREDKRAREEPAQDLSVKYQFQVPTRRSQIRRSFAIRCDSIQIGSSSDLTGSLFEQWCETYVQRRPALPSVPGVTSGNDVKRACNESTARPNPPVVSSGNGLKRAHEKSTANDDEEQPGTGARISNLIAGLQGVDAAEDDEICNGDEVPDEWLSSWYPETHMSQKTVLENEGVPCCHKRIHEKGRRRKND